MAETKTSSERTGSSRWLEAVTSVVEETILPSAASNKFTTLSSTVAARTEVTTPSLPSEKGGESRDLEAQHLWPILLMITIFLRTRWYIKAARVVASSRLISRVARPEEIDAITEHIHGNEEDLYDHPERELDAKLPGTSRRSITQTRLPIFSS
jgi:hypothetical protein